MSSSLFNPVPSMDDLIQSGRHCCAIRKYEQALPFFTRAIGSCPCARGLKRNRCTCKNFARTAAQGDSISREIMYTCHCDVGILFENCDNPYHILALDLRAASHEAMGRLDDAMNDAEWMVELAPRLPDGYLRLGKIARLQKKYEYAWGMYKTGIEINEELVVGLSPGLQELYDARESLRPRVFRQDPMRLPADIVTYIFSYLSFSENLLCLRVCKQWSRTLTSPLHAPLWRSLTLFRMPMTRDLEPSFEGLNRVLSWAGDGGARKIVVSRKTTTLTESTLMALLLSSPRLEHLQVRQLSDDSTFPPDDNMWKRFAAHAFLADHDTLSRSVYPQTSLEFAAASCLKHLTIWGIPRPWFNSGQTIPRLTELKTLRMDNSGGSYDNRLSIFYLSDAFPKLEQLSIGPGIPDLNLEPVPVWREKWGSVWPHLKVLRLEESKRPLGSIPELAGRLYDSSPSIVIEYLAERTSSTLQYLMRLNRGNSLQHIVIESHQKDWPRPFGDIDELVPELDVAQNPEFRNLRSFRSHNMCIPSEDARSLLSNAIQTKTLTSFDIVFPNPNYFPDRPASERMSLNFGLYPNSNFCHLRDYTWLRGTRTIHTLGCYRFRFGLDAENDEHLPLPQFLASFPNLRTLSIDSRHYKQDEFATVVVAIMKRTHLKTIYTTSVKGEVLDQLRQTARDRGVELIDGDRPEHWPMTLSE